MFEEMMKRAKMEIEAYYVPLFNKLNDKVKQLSTSIEQLSVTNEQLSISNEQLSVSNEQLSSQVDYLENLLKQHNIQFE